MITCENCTEEATHILVDYYHNTVEPKEFYCLNHAFDGGREQCAICESSGYGIEYHGDIYLELRPTYARGELDDEDMCSEHP